MRVWLIKVSEKAYYLIHKLVFYTDLENCTLITGMGGKGKCEIKITSPLFAFYFKSSVSSWSKS